MKVHTNEFKTNIKEFGRELDSIITYTIDGTDYELGNEELNSVTPHYEADILKSVMKQLDIDSNTDIPLGTVVNYQFGIKTRDEDEEDYRDNYDYINYGNYIVYSSEKQEDTNSYKIICYDKMLNSMKDYEDLNIIYPITIRDYINTICTHLGITFKNANETFANYDKEIAKELYLDENGTSLGYTFRDVLDELAQVTASTICINEDDDELEIRYINDTEDAIDEEYLKDINVNFGEKFGPINTIVLSRGAGADNIYYPSPLPANPIEIKITDNQIMNGNDRDTYMEDIYDQLNGLEYYINDFSSTGICYYNVCDKYDVTIGETTYSCVMLNDEALISQGLEENIYTPLAKESVTDYTKADKTDRKINQTTLIVDKQQGEIEALASSVEDLTDYLKIVEGTDTITLLDTVESNGAIGRLEISGFTSLGLYPGMSYPSDTTYPGVLTSYVITQTDENNTKYHESYIDLAFPLIATDKLIIENNKVYVKRINSDIATNQEVILNTYDDKTIIGVKYFSGLSLKCEYIIKNDFTKYFSTQAALSSQFIITSDNISTKVSKAEIISEINQSAEAITINANKVNLQGYITATDLSGSGTTTINGSNITTGTISADLIKSGSIEIEGYGENDPFISLGDANAADPYGTTLWDNGISVYDYRVGETPFIKTEDNDGYAELSGSVVNAFGFNNVSLAETKKNFEKFENALDMINKTDIYKFNYKREEDDKKKHIGIVIGDKYNYAKEMTNEKNNAADLYSMIGICVQAIKEQQEMIESLQEQIKEGK